MQMSFTCITTVVGMVGLLLGAGWLVSGRVYFKPWSMEAPEEALVVGHHFEARRSGDGLLRACSHVFKDRYANSDRYGLEWGLGGIPCVLNALLETDHWLVPLDATSASQPTRQAAERSNVPPAQVFDSSVSSPGSRP